MVWLIFRHAGMFEAIGKRLINRLSCRNYDVKRTWESKCNGPSADLHIKVLDRLRLPNVCSILQCPFQTNHPLLGCGLLRRTGWPSRARRVEQTLPA